MTHVGGQVLVAPYVDAICAEIERISEDPRAQALQTVYFGGGTPSMLTPQQIDAILQTVDRTFGIEQGAEISLESNPETVDRAKLLGFRAAGMNRFSIGAQTLQSNELKLLGRGHDAFEVQEAVSLARGAGFDSISLDLIYGTPEQTQESWRRSLEGVLALGVDHMSLYSLILEPGTTFDRLFRRGDLNLPDDDAVADMLELSCPMLEDAGFTHYEVGSWECGGTQCRHNLAYWHNDEFFAAGVGAYDYLRPYRSVRLRSVKRYIQAIEGGEDAIAHRDYVDPLDERFETAVMGLRLLTEGLNRRVYRDRFGETLESRYGSILAELQTLGFLDDDGEAVRIRQSMVQLANEAWQRFLPEPAA